MKDHVKMADSSRYIRNTVWAVISVAAGFVFFKFLLPLGIPFILAYSVSRLLRPVSMKIRSVSPRLDKPVTVILLLLITVVSGLFLKAAASFFIDRFTDFISGVSERIGSEEDPFFTLSEKLLFFADEHPLLKKYLLGGLDTSGIENMIGEAIGKLISQSADLIGRAAGLFLSSFPSIIVSFFVFFSAAFYFCLDRGELAAFIGDLLPQRVSETLKNKKMIVSRAIFGYFKTYVVMMFIVFAVVYAGLSLMRESYPFVKALLIALVDILPILGAGTVIVPWALASLISGDSFHAVALMVLLAALTVTREIAEPKIVGNNIGIPPIAALISVYFGLKLFGITGLIFFPITTSILFSVIKSFAKENTPAEAGAIEKG